MRALLPLLLLASGCGALVEPSALGEPPFTLDCYARSCPAEADVARAVDMFSDRVAIDLSTPVRIEWHAADEVFDTRYVDGERYVVIGVTTSRDDVKVTSFPVLAHELMHVRYWRATGDGDANHADPGGPWTDETDATIHDLVRAFWLDGLRS